MLSAKQNFTSVNFHISILRRIYKSFVTEIRFLLNMFWWWWCTTKKVGVYGQKQDQQR